MSSADNSWGSHRQGKSDTFNRNMNKQYSSGSSHHANVGQSYGSSKWDISQPSSASHKSSTKDTNTLQNQSSEKKQIEEYEGQEEQKRQERAKGNFDNFGLSERTKEGLEQRGIKYLFPIQAATYHQAFKSKDIIGRALTGTGKTLSFALPIIQRLRAKKVFKTSKGPKVIVLAPTRQLALQVSQQFDDIKHSTREYNVLTVYGGVSYDNQEYQLAQGVDVLVGTVGRVLDHIKKGNLRLDSVQAFVLDEADQMLNMGFKDDVQKIINFIKDERPAPSEGVKKAFQIMLYSATIPGWVKGVANEHLQNDYVNIDLVKNLKNKTAKKVDHLAINVPFYTRASTLADVLLCYGGKDKKTIVFAQTKNQCNTLLQNEKMKMSIDVLHGDIPQNQRQVTMKRFREGVIQALIATDVAARGLDIDNVDLIIQTEPPKDYETYIHRSGRTARAGKTGTCITFYTPKQKQQLQFIQFKAGIQFQRIGAPQPKDIITASSRDIHNSLDKVSDDVLPFFQTLAQDIISDHGAKKALCKALAFMSGNLSKIENRSLLTGTENQVTFQMIFHREINYTSYARNALRECNGRIASDIRMFKMLKNKKGVVFDIDERDLAEFQRNIHDTMAVNGTGKWQCTRVHDLPELQDNETSSGGGGYRGGYNNQGSGYGGSSYCGDRRNGGGRGGGNSWGNSRSNSNTNRWGNQSGNSWGNNQSSSNWQGGGYHQPSNSSWAGRGDNNSSSGGGWGNKDYSSDGKVTLFIGNLPFSATEENLNSWINKNGVSVANVRILKDQDGRSRGIGFADLSYPNDLDKALRLSRSQFDGRPISIEKCKGRQQQGSSSYSK